jgi:dTDP-4-amino-4,6-dideoxygalactose transaminase
LLAESLAAILCGQLENFDLIQNTRQLITTKYSTINIPESVSANTNDANMVAHMYYIHFPEEELLQKFKAATERAKIGIATHYQPLNNSLFMVKNQLKSPKTEISDKISRTLVRLPLWQNLNEEQVSKILDEVNYFMETLEGTYAK